MTSRHLPHGTSAVGGTAWQRAGVVAALVATAAYAGIASGARPFTIPADVAVSVPSAAFAGVLLMERIRPGTGPWRRLAPPEPVRGGAALPWVAVILLLVGVELASYFHGGPRADYPTISYGLNTLFGPRAAKAAAWFGWLIAGWFLARR